MKYWPLNTHSNSCCICESYIWQHVSILCCWCSSTEWFRTKYVSMTCSVGRVITFTLCHFNVTSLFVSRTLFTVTLTLSRSRSIMHTPAFYAFYFTGLHGIVCLVGSEYTQQTKLLMNFAKLYLIFSYICSMFKKVYIFCLTNNSCVSES